MPRELGTRTPIEPPVQRTVRSRISTLRATGAPKAPFDFVSELEASPSLPSGKEERFDGYGVMGLAFASGHLLAMRRFPSSSIGPGYRSVWHRDPLGCWTFYQDVEPDRACTRYFGASVNEVVDASIDIDWKTSSKLAITVVGGGRRVDWSLTLASSVATRLMNVLGSRLPDSWWRNQSFLVFLATIGGPILRAGKLAFSGRAPNGQRFLATPRRIWLISDTAATVQGVDLGAMGPAPTPGRLGDFWIPQRGIFAIGRAFFDAHPARCDCPLQALPGQSG